MFAREHLYRTNHGRTPLHSLIKLRKVTFILKSNQSLSVINYALIIKNQNPFDFRSFYDLIRFNSHDEKKIMVSVPTALLNVKVVVHVQIS